MTTPRLVGGIARDVQARADEPLVFTIAVDRGLASGKLDTIVLSEEKILALVADGVAALQLLAKQRGTR